MDTPLKKDLRFLLSFVPYVTPDTVTEGLSPTCYFSGTYNGDVSIAKRITDIRQRYDVDAIEDDITSGH